MHPKQQLNHRQYLEALDRMTPEQRLKKAFELSDMTRRLVMQGIRQRFPDATPEIIRCTSTSARWSLDTAKRSDAGDSHADQGAAAIHLLCVNDGPRFV